ncbi:pentatricopeptide repeat-containing protein At4g20770 [Silene latifolia]|uniref:pentatricopeptide repeat-containing protein At4g20770 n=1 Tax=Silene latifolia TaxID=37657 RepID=UPI003D787930
MFRQHIDLIANLLESCIVHKSHKLGKLLHGHIIRSSIPSNTYLFNRFIDFYFKCNDPISARRVFDEMPQRNIFSWNSMLSGLCMANKLFDAHKLFDEMPDRNVMSWNNMISAFVKVGDHGKALDMYVMMVSEGFVPTRFTLASVFRACSVLLEVELGRLCHGLAIKVGVDKNMFVGNALLTLYCKCRCVGEGIRAFKELPEPNEVSFTALMGGLVEGRRIEEALGVFKLMHRTRVCIDSVSLSSIVNTCARGEDDGLPYKVHGRLVHGLSVKLGFGNDFYFVNSLLDMYTKAGDMDSANIIFQNLSKPSVVSWNIMIAGYGRISKCDKAMETMEKMMSSGYQPDEVTLINMMASCAKSGDLRLGRRLFDTMANPTISSWNAMISGYSQIEKNEEAIMLFRKMQLQNVKPDSTTLAIVLTSCIEMGFLEGGNQVHAVSLKATVNNDIYVGSSLITLYSKSGKMDIAKYIFDQLPLVDIVCWNAILAGFSANSREKEAFDFFDTMRRRDIRPTQFSYATMVSCCAKQSFPSQGKQLHAQIVKFGFINDIYVGSALIDMYCKCGNVSGAQDVFDAMPVKNVVVWNEMIHGYAQNGYGNVAARLYSCMISAGEEPDNITFVVILTACSHSGLVDEGIKIFESMLPKHKIKPSLDHYTCIIDALGRAGRLHEAEMLIMRLPCKDDPVIWEILLSSCRVYSDIFVAKRAAEKLFSLNPRSCTPYVLLGNIYSSEGRWEEARAIRELMDTNDLNKDGGYSWTDNVDRFKTCEIG